jgi:DNA replication and repair protein RecF
MAETGPEEIRDAILESLSLEKKKEARTGHTMVGPHRDLILFVLGDAGEAVDLSRYGSQGQKRSAVLAFKMALAWILADVHGEWPLVLLDDVASELDNSRRKALGHLVLEMKAQFFISTTGKEYLFLPAGEGKMWKVENGELIPFS